MYMYKRICITNRHLADDLMTRIGEAIDAGADMVVLREKDMDPAGYEALARRVIALCEEKGADCFLHTFTEVAERLGRRDIHLTMGDFRGLTEEERKALGRIGVSTHTVEEAKECARMGAAYVTASPVFETDCKPGVVPSGLTYLAEAAAAVDIPVYALGGIREDNAGQCLAAGAAGVCMMSGYMKPGNMKEEA